MGSARLLQFLVHLAAVTGDNPRKFGNVFGGGPEIHNTGSQQVAAFNDRVGDKQFPADFQPRLEGLVGRASLRVLAAAGGKYLFTNR